MRVYVKNFGFYEMEFESRPTAADLCRNLRQLKVFGCAFHVENDAPDGSTFRVRRRHVKKKTGNYITVVYMPRD